MSIETQLEVCRDYATKHGWTIAEEFVDHAVSGTRYKIRPVFWNSRPASNGAASTAF